MLVSLSVSKGVTALASPVKVGLAMFAFRLFAVVTKAVVARAVVESPAVWVVPIVPVGRVGVPVKVGEARGANPEIEAPDGMVTVPVKVGLARGALPLKAVLRSVCDESVPVMAPQATEVAGVTPPTLTTHDE